jgi:hypothetical protein
MAKTIVQRLAALEKAVADFLGGKSSKTKAKRSKRKSAKARKAVASRKAAGGRKKKARKARRPAALPFPPG